MSNLLRNIAGSLQKMPRGDAMTISRSVLREIGSHHLVGFFGPEWSPAEQILENVVGSAYEFSFTEDPMTGDTTFYRRKESLTDNRRTYVAPDRRDRFVKDKEGLYSPI